MNDNLPMCFAVCVCGKNDWETEHLLPVAIQCYFRQDYPQERRMLLLVTEAENAHKLRGFRAPDVKLLAVAGNPTLGELRNVAIRFVCEQAPGGYLIQWDGDDGHATGRMSAQMNACLAVPGAASFLKRQIAYSLANDIAFVRYLRIYGEGHPPAGTETMIHGTFCGPANDIRYPPLKRGEDTPYWKAWCNGPGAIEIDNRSELYLRFAHGNSTSGDAHILQDHADDHPGAWSLSNAEAAYLKQFLAHFGFSRHDGGLLREVSSRPSHG